MVVERALKEYGGSELQSNLDCNG